MGLKRVCEYAAGCVIAVSPNADKEIVAKIPEYLTSTYLGPMNIVEWMMVVGYFYLFLLIILALTRLCESKVARWIYSKINRLEK